MSLAGASRAVVPGPDCPAAAALPAALFKGAGIATAPDADRAGPPAVLATELALVPEHPARRMAPPSMALPIASAATA